MAWAMFGVEGYDRRRCAAEGPARGHGESPGVDRGFRGRPRALWAGAARSETTIFTIFPRQGNNDLKTLRDNAAKQLLKIINEILSEYSTKNKISLIMEKKNIVIGKTELDITKNILVLLNTKIKKVELK